MIELVEGLWINPEDVKVIKRISDTKCSLWMTGQSALDGFVIDHSAEDVLEALEVYLYGGTDDEEEEDDEEGD